MHQSHLDSLLFLLRTSCIYEESRGGKQWQQMLERDKRENMEKMCYIRPFNWLIGTLYNIILHIARNFLETSENIKISNPSILPYKFGLIFMGMKQKKKIEKKNQNGRLKKTEFFKIANSQKIS